MLADKDLDCPKASGGGHFDFFAVDGVVYCFHPW